MTITVDIIEDSISSAGDRLTTMVARYPRIIHSEMMTHRAFSRNGASSRAIPVQKIIHDVLNDPGMPVSWMVNKPGMQGGEPMSDEAEARSRMLWLQARDKAVGCARKMLDHSEPAHKQIINRLLEPFSHMTFLITATDYDNFFDQRLNDYADPTIHAVAVAMKMAMQNSAPVTRKDGEWHLPFITEKDLDKAVIHVSSSNRILSARTFTDAVEDVVLAMSVARCARVSYNNHYGQTPTVEQDMKLYQKLVEADPAHASPTEHQAYAQRFPMNLSSNLAGWVQYRKILGL